MIKKLAKNIEEFLVSKDFGEKLEEGKFLDNPNHYQNLIESMESPWIAIRYKIAIRYNKGYSSEEWVQRISPRISAFGAWDYISDNIKKYAGNDISVGDIPFRATLREKGNGKHLTLSVDRRQDGIEYSCMIYINEQSTPGERVSQAMNTLLKYLKI